MSRENVSWGCIGRAAFPDLAEAGNHGTPQQSKQRRHYENTVENELGVQLADTLRETVKNGICRWPMDGGVAHHEVVVLVAIDGEHGGVARVSAGGVEGGALIQEIGGVARGGCAVCVCLRRVCVRTLGSRWS